MNADCYPVTALPHVSDLYRDYVSGNWEKLRAFYPETAANDGQWMKNPPQMDPSRRYSIVELLRQQNRELGAGPETQSNLDRLAAGAGAVVTGQQVALFGGPLMTFMKAATAIHLAAEATRAATRMSPSSGWPRKTMTSTKSTRPQSFAVTTSPHFACRIIPHPGGPSAICPSAKPFCPL